MYPSTLWSSFPKRPQGLNVMIHLSPVLSQNDNTVYQFPFSDLWLSNIHTAYTAYNTYICSYARHNQ